MSEQARGLDQQDSDLLVRVNHLTELVNQLVQQNIRTQPAVVQPQQSQTNVDMSIARNGEQGFMENSAEIDEYATINLEVPRSRRDAGRRTSSLLAGLPELMRAAHSARTSSSHRSNDHPSIPNTTASTVKQASNISSSSPQQQVVVATEIKIGEDEKLDAITVRAVRYLNRKYRDHKRKHPYSRLTIADFISYRILKMLRSNELARGTDLSNALRCVEDFWYVSDDSVRRALARLYRTQWLHAKDQTAQRLWVEVGKIKWPAHYHNSKTNTYHFKPEGFHITMHSTLIDFTQAIRETVEFMYLDATDQELKDQLPPLTYGSRDVPGMFQYITRGYGELTDSITTLITVERLKLVKDIYELVNLLDSVSDGFAAQRLALAQQEARSTKPEKADAIWEKTQELQRQIEKKTSFSMPRPRQPNPTYSNRGSAVIHSMESVCEEHEEQSDTVTVAEVTPIKSEGEELSFHTSYEYLGEEELFLFSPAGSKTDHMSKSDPNLPCFNDYNGECKLGQLCPYVKSHGNRRVMEERTKKLLEQALKSKYGGPALVREITMEFTRKSNLQPSPGSQVTQYQAITRSTPSPGSNETRFSHRELTPSRPEGNQPFSRPVITSGGRDQNGSGRGGGRLVTYAGRGNMGRARYTNHILQDDNQQDDENQVGEVSEGEQEESC